MRTNILVVVEGKKAEPTLLKQISKSFGLDFEFYCLESNIYALYKELKKLDFNCNIKDILAERHPNQRAILSNKFAYTYLVFDCDAHHSEKGDPRTIEQIIQDNFQKLTEMANYFVDETDPTIGRLYINFPMVESFRDCDSFFDNSYAENCVDIRALNGYKTIVSKRKLTRIHLNTYTKDNWTSLILQNAFKLNKIMVGQWRKPSYNDYLDLSILQTIVDKENELASMSNKLAVLNMSLFIILDYFGNKTGFYDLLNDTTTDNKA